MAADAFDENLRAKTEARVVAIGEAFGALLDCVDGAPVEVLVGVATYVANALQRTVREVGCTEEFAQHCSRTFVEAAESDFEIDPSWRPRRKVETIVDPKGRV